MNETIYANGIYVKQNPKFEGLNVSINCKEFIKFLEDNTNSKGYCNIAINPRKVPTEFGITHLVKLNTWEPKESQESTKKTMVNDGQEDCGDLPEGW